METQNRPAPTARMLRLNHHLVEHLWGEPSESIVFAADATVLDQAEVAMWHPDEDCDVLTFATLGMSELVMPHQDYRAELTLGVRGTLPEAEQSDLARFLANVARYPFVHDLSVDWWHRLNSPGIIPAFPGCTKLLFTPLPGDDEDSFHVFPAPDADVKVLACIPITRREDAAFADGGWDALCDYCSEFGVDLHEPRHDPAV